MESSLHSYLSSKTSITNLVGSNIWRGRLPQSYSWSSPAITFRRISEPHDHNLDGASGIAQARVQIDCWARSAATADNVAEQVRLVLQGYSGTLGTITATSVVLDNVVSIPEQPKDASDEWRYHIALDFLIFYRESVPQF